MALAVLATGDWSLSCTDQEGVALGGIDCLQHDAVPTTTAPPAPWLGFLGGSALAALPLAVLATVLVPLPWRAFRGR